ncbi:serine/threonine protein kinase [Streptomyces sp. NPDC020917]|uniref:serine/threonine protein kinase n=1 Tax=Streptomyces sp. NPDC020917 TaxID=3365102 RepID=UPI00378E0EF8
MDDYAGRVLADRYRLPRPPADEFELVETRAFDTYSGQEVLVHQVLLPEVVTAELADGEGGFDHPETLGESARRALDAARAAAAVPDHPRMVQVFDIFVEDGSLWIASELVPARPLAALLAERPMDAFRAAEVAADVLTALRALHAYGWTHRNVTASTVLVLDDGRAMLTGLAAGAAQEALCGYDPVPEEVLAGHGGSGAGDDGTEAEGGGEQPWHGPQSALEQERARQNRITVVGAVTERWSPEQAHEVHENWRLSPPVGPAADLWALGALLFRSVQGHPPFPEENAAELVQLVCAEPPAFAEDCGPLRPVVESLLRPDPEERPEAEELGGWLRSLVRAAPEPDVGVSTVQVPTDPARLPVKRRRGELVRRRRRAAAAAADAGMQHRRHARGKQARPAKASKSAKPAKLPRQTRSGSAELAPAKTARIPRQAANERNELRQEQLYHREQVVSRRPARGEGGPRRLGARLLIGILVLLIAVVLYALLGMPHRNASDNGAGGTRTVPAAMSGGGGDDGHSTKPATSAPATHPATRPATHAPTSAPVTAPPDLGSDFALRTDPAGFTVAVHTGWARSGENGRHQVRYTGSDLELLVVPGRDKATGDSQDPLAYQLIEPELADFRSSAWSSASSLQALTVRGHDAAEGEYTWRDANDRTVYARNLAVQIGGRYHVILITGPDSERAAVQRAFDKAVETYTAG